MEPTGKVWLGCAIAGAVITLAFGWVTGWYFRWGWYAFIFVASTAGSMSAWSNSERDEAIKEMNERQKREDTPPGSR